MLWDDELECWFARVENVPDESFEIYIQSESPLNFFAVKSTHQTYQRLIGDLPAIRRQAFRELIENEKRISAKRRERKFIAEVLEKEVEIFSITIYEDLSSEIRYDAEIFDDEWIVVLIGANGEFLDVGVIEDI
jgi:hypothetical protein